MIAGLVQRIFTDKGFGFVRDPATGTEYFFHRSAVEGETPFEDLEHNQPVTFTPAAGTKGPRATQVRAQERTR